VRSLPGKARLNRKDGGAHGHEEAEGTRGGHAGMLSSSGRSGGPGAELDLQAAVSPWTDDNFDAI